MIWNPFDSGFPVGLPPTRECAPHGAPKKRSAVKQTYSDNVEHNIGDKKVVERPPIVLNYVFSGQAKKMGNVTAARKENIPGRLEMLQDYLKNNPNSRLSESIKQAFKDSYDEKLRNNPSHSDCEILEKNLLCFVNSNLNPPEQRHLAEGLLFGLTGKVYQNGSLHDPKDMNLKPYELSAMEILYDMPLIDAAGIAFSSECKSGNDRTATSVALRIAQRSFKEKFGEDFSYLKEKDKINSDKMKYFKEVFTNAFIQFGGDNVKYSRGKSKNGKPEIKVGSSPVYKLFANENEVEEHLDVVPKKKKNLHPKLP